MRPTMPLTRRLPYSITAWVFSGATTEPKHLGQSGQPRPLPVRRTPAPVSTMTPSATRAIVARRA